MEDAIAIAGSRICNLTESRFAQTRDPAGYYIIDNLLPSQSSRNTGNKVNNKGLRVLIDRRNPTDTLPLISDLDIASHMDARRLEFMCETSSLMKL